MVDVHEVEVTGEVAHADSATAAEHLFVTAVLQDAALCEVLGWRDRAALAYAHAVEARDTTDAWTVTARFTVRRATPPVERLSITSGIPVR